MNTIYSLFLVILVTIQSSKVSVATSSDVKHFRCDYKYYDEAGGWLKLHERPVDFTNAHMICQFEGATLASPLNEQLKKSMRNLIEGNKLKCDSVFTGLHSIAAGEPFTLEGVPLSKIPHEWADKEPDNYNSEENCVSMESDGKLADVNCNETLPFICYKKFTKKLIINQCGTTDFEYSLDVSTGSCYKLHRVARNWMRAHMACAAEGAHLAIINSDAEAKVFAAIFARNPEDTIKGGFWSNSAFLGYRAFHDNEDLLTIEGQTLQEAGYSTFFPGQPKLTEKETYCGAMARNATLFPILCKHRQAFLCEKSPDSLLC